MKQTAKHAPLPWKAIFQRQPLATDHWAIETKNGKYTPAGMVLNEANAEFIVKACNSHYELLQACNDVVSHLVSNLDYETFRGYLKDRLRQAIAKAEGR